MVESIKELRRICYDGRKGPLTLYNKHIGMKVSIYITKLLLYTPITANHVTLAMLILGIVGSISLFNGHFLIGLLLIHFTVILDDVDGEIARYRKKPSMLGMYIDTMYHIITSHLMFFGYAYALYSIYQNKLLLIFGFLSAIFSHSIVVPSIFDTIVSLRIRGLSTPPLNAKKNIVTEFEGQAKSFQSIWLRLYHSLRNIWSFPTNLIMLTLVAMFEFLNANYLFLMESYQVTTAFFVIYGTVVTLNNILSFIFHVRKNSIDSFYDFLFGKNNH